MRRRWLGWCLFALSTVCEHAVAGSEPRYRDAAPDARNYAFGVHPAHAPLRQLEIYGPLVDYLDRNLNSGVRLSLQASPNYREFERGLYGREFEFALANPYQVVNALCHGYQVIAKMGDDQTFAGILVVRRDGAIRRPADLKHKKVAYPDPTSVAGAMLPQYYLQTHGVDVNRETESLYVGSHESALMNVYLGHAAAAGVRRSSWETFQREHPEHARTLVAQWDAGSLINVGVVVRNDVPGPTAARTAQLLDQLHTIEEGRAILARMPLTRFELSDNATYRAIDVFLREFDRAVRPLKRDCP